eukprot:gene14432-19368_t
MISNDSDGSQISDDHNGFSDWVDDLDKEDISVKSLFSDIYFPSVEELLHYDLNNYSFDLKHIIELLCIVNDFQSIVMLINFIRVQVSKESENIFDKSRVEGLIDEILAKSFLDEAIYMKPALENDQLLFSLQDTLVRLNGDLMDDNEEDIMDFKSHHISNMLTVERKSVLKKILDDSIDFVGDNTSDELIDMRNIFDHYHALREEYLEIYQSVTNEIPSLSVLNFQTIIENILPNLKMQSYMFYSNDPCANICSSVLTEKIQFIENSKKDLLENRLALKKPS